MKSDTKTNGDVVSVASKTETEQKKRAEILVRKSLQNTWLPLKNREVDNRFMPGLWMLTVNILISCLDVDDIIKILTNRVHDITQIGENDDAKPISLTSSQITKYTNEIVLAAETINECVSEAIVSLENEELDDRLPEAMLDSAIFILENGWGPKHLKRAITEQVTAFLTGNITPILFLEPSRMVELSKTEKVVEQEPVEKIAVTQESIEDVDVNRPEKTIRVFIDYNLTGSAAPWVSVIEKTSNNQDEDMQELHLLQGSVKDFNGRVAPIKAAIEALKALQHEKDGSHISFETVNAFCVRGMDGDEQEKSAFRHESEKELWEEFDFLLRNRKISYKISQRNLSDRAQHIGDVAMKCGVANIL